MDKRVDVRCSAFVIKTPMQGIGVLAVAQFLHTENRLPEFHVDFPSRNLQAGSGSIVAWFFTHWTS